MIQTKKGISDVVTTVLIILLVLAAIVIIWGFISGQLNQTQGQIDLRSQCLQTTATVTCTKGVTTGTGTAAVTDYTTSITLSGSVSKILSVTSIVVGSDGVPDAVEIDGSENQVSVSQTHADLPGTSAKASASYSISDGAAGTFACPASPEVDCV